MSNIESTRQGKIEKGNTMIRLKRDSGYVDRMRAYKVMLDGEQVAKIKNGEQIEIDVAPGNHELYLKIDWCQSNRIEFDLNKNAMEFECGSSLRGDKFWIPFIELYYITFKRKEYIWLSLKNNESQKSFEE